jgi:glycosyltransferase involved in cell wall biosynthesis
MTTRLVSIHAMDPRGTKVGGMETHVRQLLRRHPADMAVVMIGIDDRGDLPLGRPTQVTVSGRDITFIPVLRVPETEQANAAKTVGNSLTFRFARALIRYLPALRGLAGGPGGVAEVERFEYAPFARLLGLPLVTLVHNEGTRGDKMDSVLSRHWWVHDVAEWLAFRLSARIFCVTPKLKERLATRHPSQGGKAEVLTVSVDTQLFHATPFDLFDGVFRLIYAGRLDEFKDPALMFRVAKRLHERLNGAFEFHYCGAADPHRFPEFAAIEAFTVRHGALLPDGVAAAMRGVHAGILVSHWEGMPCFLLELLASGRPFGGLRLPQFDQVVATGVSGRMVERAETVEASVEAVADTLVALRDDVFSGRIDPAEVHARILPFSVENQLARLFQAHRDLARGSSGAAPLGGPATGGAR